MSGGSLICMATCVSGVRIGIRDMLIVAIAVAAVVVMRRSTVLRPIVASAANLATATVASDSAL